MALLRTALTTLGLLALEAWGQGCIPTVTLQNGTYTGVHQSTYGQDYFLGIPFAQPPLGDLRFRVPQPLNTTWEGSRNATAYYPECVGYGGDQIGYEVSEDCLALNVIRPSGYDGQPLPVGVWIHGGGYVMGGTPDRRYNLSFIVQNSVSIGKPIMGVSIAYRLSAWGFLDGQEVRDEEGSNLGMKDQRLALQWVQQNVEAFGGDPAKVTIFGESAGAGSVGIHAIAYGGRDDRLFRGIIGESGSPILLGPAYNLSVGQATFDNISATVGCSNSTDTLGCLRSTNYETLNAAINTTVPYVFNPYVDGDMIQGSTYEQLLNGSFVKVPYLIGSNSDEGTAFGMRGVNNDSDFRNYMASTGADEQSVAILEATYPNIPSIGIPETVTEQLNTTYGLQYKRSAAFGGDFAFTAARRLTNQQYARYNATSYAYRFNAIPYPLDSITGVTHFQEVAFVFNNINGLGYAENPFHGKPPSYYTLSKLMSCMWVSFIHDGNPNNHGQIDVPEWPEYSNGNGGVAASGFGGYGKTFVFQANRTGSYIEDDNYRATGIATINSMWGSQFGK